ncbi:hypothetical protein N4120_001266 [Campylobacter coli]|nr:hypothetical protein [Campylobacter coli]EJU4056860.1 hypothetical protein [Campylobacter coli]HED6194408.1 hypothetical protein [Campylobacter coli]
MKKFILISSILSSFFIFAEANELPSDKIQPEVKVIKEHFKNKVEKIEFEAWAKGMGLNFSTQKYLNNQNYKNMPKLWQNSSEKQEELKARLKFVMKEHLKKEFTNAINFNS